MDPMNYPLKYVPIEALQKLAQVFDTESVTGISFGVLAQKMDGLMGYRLGLNTPVIRQIQERSKTPTADVILEAGKRGATVYILQRAITELEAAAHDILPQYLPEIRARYQKELMESRPGYPHTCICPTCMRMEQPRESDFVTTSHSNYSYPDPHNYVTGPLRLNIPPPPPVFQAPHGMHPHHACYPPNTSYHDNQWVSRPHPHAHDQSGQHMYSESQFFNNGPVPRSPLRTDVRVNNMFMDNTIVKDSYEHKYGPRSAESNSNSQTVSSHKSFTESNNPQERFNIVRAETHEDIIQVNSQGLQMHQQQRIPGPPGLNWIAPDEDEDIEDSSSEDNASTTSVDCTTNRKEKCKSVNTEHDKVKSSMEPSDSVSCSSERAIPVASQVIVRQRPRSNTDSSVNQRSSNPCAKNRYSDEPKSSAQSSNESRCTCGIRRKEYGPTSGRQSINESGSACRIKRKETILFSCKDKDRMIFVTFAEHDKHHMSEVLRLCNSLKNELGFKIKCDMMEELFVQEKINPNEWIDTYFAAARYILICVSPLYSTYTQPDSDSASAQPNNNKLHTRYIFDRARSEFIANQSLNTRFLPVIFKNSCAKLEHLPDFLRSTLHYYYPSTTKDLKKFLISQKHG